MVERVRVLSEPEGESMTKQSMAAECDVNYIISRYRVSGQLPPGRGPGSYGDFSTGADFYSAMNMVRKAEESFRALPSKVREYCRNDPAVFLDMCMDPERTKELQALGLVAADVPEKAVLVRMAEPEKGSAEPPVKAEA